MPIGCGRGIYDGGFRLYPGSDHRPAHSTGGKTDTRVAAYPFDLPSICQGVDIQDAMLFSKPYGGRDWRPIPFETLQIEILLVCEGGQVWALHGNAFMLDTVGVLSCHSVPGIRRPSVPQQQRGLIGSCARSMLSRTHTASDHRLPSLTAVVGHSHR